MGNYGAPLASKYGTPRPRKYGAPSKYGGGSEPTDDSAKLETELTDAGVSLPKMAAGLGRNALDVISRPLYAVAGFADELINPEGDATRPLKRVGEELFSGVGDIQGKKRGFGEVLERAGVSDLGHLSDIAPFLYSDTGEGAPLKRGGILDPSGRGAIGLAGDVALDPLTYLTFGASTGVRIGLKEGVKYVTKEGSEIWRGIQEGQKVALKLARETDNPVIRIAAEKQIQDAARDEMAKVLRSRPDLLEPDGIKWFGQQVVSGATLSKFSEPVKNAILSSRVGAMAAKGAEAFSNGVRRIFDPHSELIGLPEGVREEAIRMSRDRVSSSAMLKLSFAKHWDAVNDAWKPLKAKTPEQIQKVGERFTQWRQGTKAVELTADESRAFQALADFYDKYEPLAVHEGVITAEQAQEHADRYLHQVWENTDELEKYHPQPAGHTPSFLERFQKDRQFKTVDEGINFSKAKNAEDRAWAAAQPGTPIYPVLKPDYDVLKNAWAYANQLTDAIWEKRFVEDIRGRFGIDLAVHDPKRVYDLDRVAQLGAKDAATLEKFFEENRTLSDLTEAATHGTVTALTPELKLAKTRLSNVLKSAPVKYVETERLRNIDEFRYYKRRGWDVVEEGPDNYLASRPRDVGKAQYTSWNAAVKKAVSEVESASGRAARSVPLRDANGARLDGWEELARLSQEAMSKLGPEGQSEMVRRLVSMARSPGQILALEKAIPNFRELAPKLRNAVLDGDVEPFFTKMGLDPEKATIVTKSGSLWGDPVRVPKAIADLVEGAPRLVIRDETARGALRKMVRGYDKYNNLFKAITYPFYPAGAVRDTYNNVMHSYLWAGAGAFRRPLDAIGLLKGGEGRMTINGVTSKLNEWKRLASELGVFDPSASQFVQFTGEEASRTGLLSKARIARGKVDNWTRGQLWLNAMHEGLSPRDAADVVKEFHYAYNELSAFDRDWMKRLVPFWVFPRKSIELYGRMVGRRPGRVVNLAKPFMGRESENRQMTQWEGEGFKIRLEGDGKTVTMVNGVDLPIRTLDTLWDGTPKRTLQNFLSMVSPAIKVPYMVASGQDPFTGQDLGRMDAPTIGRAVEPMPKWVQAWTGYKKEVDAAGRPKYSVRADRVKVLQEALLISRIFSTSDRQFRESARQPGFAARALDIMTGLRFKTLDLSEEQKRIATERAKMLEDLAVQQGLRKEFSRSYKPKAR